jgi:hypothetical protein
LFRCPPQTYSGSRPLALEVCSTKILRFQDLARGDDQALETQRNQS